MDAMPPGDQISRLLHVVVIEICQRIVSYTDELVVSGMVFVKADGVPVCRVPFDDAIRGKDCAASSNGPSDKSLNHDDNHRLSVDSVIDEDCVTPASFLDEKIPSELQDVGSLLSPTVNSTAGVAAGKTASCMEERSMEGCGRYERILKCKELGFKNGATVNAGRALSVGNLGEMVMEYWQQITPELLKASALLCKLGELQKAIDTQSVSLSDRNVSSRKRSLGGNRSKMFYDGDCGKDFPTTRPSFLQTLGSDCRSRNQCRLCQKVFTFATNLRRHQRNFHGRPLSRDARRASGSKSVLGSSRSLADLSGFGSHRTSSVVLGAHPGHSLSKSTDSLEMEYSIPMGGILDQELETGSVAVVTQHSSTSHSNADQNLECETGRASAAPVACQDEELEVCDVRPEENENLAAESGDASRKDGSRDKAFAVVEVVGGCRHAGAECYAFDDCSCWDKSGDSMLDPISVDVSDDNSVHYFDECCSLDGCSGPPTSDGVGDILTAADSTVQKVLMTDTITVGSPGSARSLVEGLEESRMKRFKCLSCDASFSMSNNLQRHVKKVHAALKDIDRPHKAPDFEAALDVLNCGSTGESKMSRSSRYRHMCELCGAAFTFRTNMTRHMKKIHHQIPSILDVSAAKARDRSSLTQ